MRKAEDPTPSQFLSRHLVFKTNRHSNVAALLSFLRKTLCTIQIPVGTISLANCPNTLVSLSSLVRKTGIEPA